MISANDIQTRTPTTWDNMLTGNGLPEDALAMARVVSKRRAQERDEGLEMISAIIGVMVFAIVFYVFETYVVSDNSAGRAICPLVSFIVSMPTYLCLVFFIESNKSRRESASNFDAFQKIYLEKIRPQAMISVGRFLHYATNATDEDTAKPEFDVMRSLYKKVMDYPSSPSLNYYFRLPWDKVPSHVRLLSLLPESEA